jgi:hypothetical protein
MTAVVTRSRSTSTLLTGAAGLLILAAAFVMMVCAAPRVRTPLLAGTAQAVTTHCDQLASSGKPVRAGSCRIDPSTLSAWTKPYARSTIMESRAASRLARPSRPIHQ